MSALFGVIHLFLGVLAFAKVRWAYVAFTLTGLVYFPIKVGFDFRPRPCQLTFTAPLAMQSVGNFGHVLLFGIFMLMSWRQFANPRREVTRSYMLAAAATVAMGVLVELTQGITGGGTCRSRDLIPDVLGILWAVIAIEVWRRFIGERLPFTRRNS